MTSRRFPPPVERLPGGFKVIDANGHARQRRLASNFAKLPSLLAKGA